MEVSSLLDIPFDNLSVIGLVGAAIVANVFPAIPEEIFLLSFGYLANTKPVTFPFSSIVFFLILGFLAIDSVVYYLAKRGSKIINFIVGKILAVDLKNKEEFLKKNTGKIIFISRFLVQLRTIGPVTAAMVNYPFRKFLLMDFLALAIYVPALMGIGYYFTDRIERIFSGANVVHNIMMTVVISLAAIIIIRQMRKRLMKIIMGEVNRVKSFFGLKVDKKLQEESKKNETSTTPVQNPEQTL